MCHKKEVIFRRKEPRCNKRKLKGTVYKYIYVIIARNYQVTEARKKPVELLGLHTWAWWNRVQIDNVRMSGTLTALEKPYLGHSKRLRGNMGSFCTHHRVHMALCTSLNQFLQKGLWLLPNLNEAWFQPPFCLSKQAQPPLSLYSSFCLPSKSLTYSN